MRERWLDAGLVLAAVASAVTASWLLLVVLTVLPSRDPTSIPGWTVFALGLFAFVALTFIDLRRRPVPRLAHVAFTVASLVAIAVGAWVLIGALAKSVDFEGYLVVIGAVVLVHGVAGALRLMEDIRMATRPSR